METFVLDSKITFKIRECQDGVEPLLAVHLIWQTLDHHECGVIRQGSIIITAIIFKKY